MSIATRPRSWTEVHRYLFPDATFPPRKHETDIAGFLFERGYYRDLIRSILDHIDGHGSIECYSPDCSLTDDDRARIEELIPDAPIGVWNNHRGTWAITGD